MVELFIAELSDEDMNELSVGLDAELLVSDGTSIAPGNSIGSSPILLSGSRPGAAELRSPNGDMEKVLLMSSSKPCSQSSENWAEVASAICGRGAGDDIDDRVGRSVSAVVLLVC